MSALDKDHHSNPEHASVSSPDDSPTQQGGKAAGVPPASALEVEVKFSVEDSTPVPELSAIQGVESVQPVVVHELSAVYFDTADLRLTRNKITLRRRTGGKDEGWHVKLPATGGGRREIHAPLGEYEFTPPRKILAVIRPYVRRADLDPIAQIDNERHEYILDGADGQPVAEFVDDHVTAYSLLPGGDISTWREWELELANDADGQPRMGTELLSDAAGVLHAAGARTADSPSKLVSALGESINNAQPLAQPAQLDSHDPAARVIAALLSNRNKIIALDGPVREDAYDSIHQMRVATRELRSHMSTFSGILVGERYEHLGDELKHMAKVLGHARDAEVVAARFQQSLGAQEPEFVDDEVSARLTRGMDEVYQREHAQVVEFLDSDRYAQLLDDLDEVLAHPPLAGVQEKPSQEEAAPQPTEDCPAPETEAETEAEAETHATAVEHQEQSREEAATEVLIGHLHKAVRRVKRLHRVASEQRDASVSLAQREEAYHELRKAVKKLRYSVEAVGAASGINTRKLYRACSRAQDVLGEFQDTVTARETLAAVAQRAHAAGEDTFLYGMLYQQELDNGVAALREYPAAMEDVFDAYEALVKKQRKRAAKAKARAEKDAEKRALREAKAAKKASRAKEKKAKKAKAKEKKLKKATKAKGSKKDVKDTKVQVAAQPAAKDQS